MDTQCANCKKQNEIKIQERDRIGFNKNMGRDRIGFKT